MCNFDEKTNCAHFFEERKLLLIESLSFSFFFFFASGENLIHQRKLLPCNQKTFFIKTYTVQYKID